MNRVCDRTERCLIPTYTSIFAQSVLVVGFHLDETSLIEPFEAAAGWHRRYESAGTPLV
ncbi:hypothetical protein [Paraburkholderia lycopersici]|uniref:hypothetical protein n=1 Tax=Paraburkholderia lycopersici TaxID=416944 RepID=UPI0015A487EC|nr:hypothetical protein [Paraburkholderia lycopersici]